MIQFNPLYWIYHDCWKYTETLPPSPSGEENVAVRHHAGHVHFFMPDLNPVKTDTQKAYSGSEVHSFRIRDVWGPNSDDPNQTRSYRLVGKPIWKFTIREYWRRVYVQPWDVEDYSSRFPSHKGRLGVRYDASLPCHTFGPFREGRGFYFFDTEMNRTLPVEYWLDEGRTRRQHLLRRSHYAEGAESWDETRGGQEWNFAELKNPWSRRGKGAYWAGDNAKYDSEGRYAGFYGEGEVVSVGEMESLHWTGKKFYANRFSPSVPTASMGGAYYPNPTPGGDFATHSLEYLAYFDFHGDGTLYVSRYEAWLGGREGNEAEFSAFVSGIAPELYASCREMYGQDTGTMQYEYVTFEEFRGIWERLSREEELKLEVYGSYPPPVEGAAPTEYGEDQYHDKDGNPRSPYEAYKEQFAFRDVYTIPRGTTCKGDVMSSEHPLAVSFSDEDGARRSYSDNLYVTPVIEYQVVVQLDGERLPEAEERDAGVDFMTDTSEAFGDGFEVEVEIPFRVRGEIQSPFSDAAGKVHPPPHYFHGKVKDGDRMRYALESYGEEVTGEQVERESTDGEGNPCVPASFAKAAEYSPCEFNSFMAGNPTFEEQAEWFNSNYAGRPILMDMGEGRFCETGEWKPIRTNDRPTAGQASLDGEGKPTLEAKAVEFRNDWYEEDGRWVEQCLGAEVIPTVELVFEDALGHRWIESVSDIQRIYGEFVGK